MIKLTNLIVFVIAFAASVTAFGQGADVSYKQGDAKLKGYYAKPKGGKKNAPGVLILPAWMGLDQHSKEAADKLAQLGYHALAADIYGEGNNPKNFQEAGAKAGSFKKDYKLYQDRIKAGLDELIKLGADPKRIVVMGYCFGGTGALEAARAGFPVQGVVSFHGGLGKDSTRAANAITPKVLVLHGADDPYVPEKEVKSFVKEMNDAKADWQMIYYSDAVHAFTDKAAGNDKSRGAAYNEKADKRSWEHLKVFLKEIFGE